MNKEKLEKILKQVADTKGVKNYQLVPHAEALGGDGFLSQCYTGYIVNMDTGFKIQIFIKISLPLLGTFTSWAYCNEYHFYTSIFPQLHNFQLKQGVKDTFKNIPEFYCGNDKEDEKYLAMENLMINNYAMADKSQDLSTEHLKVIFETYGKFHALSFAFREQNFEDYSQLTKPLKNLFVGNDVTFVIGSAERAFSAAYNAVKEINSEIASKVKSIKDNFAESYVSAATYNGSYSGLTHGDCWSNNMVFKNGEDGKILDMKIIDFQLCLDSTPIHDLSYLFYSGASREDFEKLDEYLEVYHKSFSAFARELGSDAEKLLPLSVLKAEWKKYGLFGIMMAIMLWKTKLTSKEQVKELAFSKAQANLPEFNPLVTKSDYYKKKTTDILFHAVNYEII